MEKQTAVDWLIDQLEKYELYSKISFQCLKEIEQAKQMEKQEIIEAYSDGAKGGANDGKGQHKNGWVSIQMKEQYYNETFGKL
jgi:hypothetical protein